jgi:hypothetical protein
MRLCLTSDWHGYLPEIRAMRNVLQRIQEGL